MPAQPWVLASGASGQIEVSVDLRGKSGVLMKSLSLDTTVGPRHVVFKVNIPGNPLAQAAMADRLKNQQLALADRQAVFKGDCARCHAEPARGRTGGELFAAACVICHDTPHRASMVPDLYALNKPVDAHYWRTWISFGREGSLMPAFAQSRGGPLTDEQIASVVEYLITNPLRRAPQVRVIPAPLAPTVPRPASPPPQPPAAPR
jgi:mono/diheme cytochrome c family protein